MSNVICPVLFGTARTGGDVSAFLSKSMNFNSFSLTGPNVAGWYFFNLLFKGAARRAKFKTKRLNTLHNLKKDRSSVRLVGVFIPLMASVL